MRKISRRQFLKGAAVTGTALLVASYPLFIERYLIRLNTYSVPVPRLPEAFNDFTIVQLTDLHYGTLTPLSWLEKVIDRVNAFQKDAVVLTGDYVIGVEEKENIARIWKLMMKLKAPSGVFNVLGNHDHWLDTDESMKWLNKSGQSIQHKTQMIEKRGNRIWIGGAGDLWEDELGLDRTFKNVPDQECKLVLAHNPDSADHDFNVKIDLMIAGHTHGGQVNIPFIGTPVLPVMNKLYASGFVRTPKTNLFISSGIGWAFLPIRFNCPPEISILKLKAEPKS